MEELLFVKLRIIYSANILTAGFAGVLSLVNTKKATAWIFQGKYQRSEVIRLVGWLWVSIAALSVMGLVFPLEFSPVLVLQLLYKSGWLLFSLLSGIFPEHSRPVPRILFLFFLVWVHLLPLFIPWSYLFGGHFA